MLLKWVDSNDKYSLIIQTDSITSIKPNGDDSYIIRLADGDSETVNGDTLDWIIKQVDNEVVTARIKGAVSRLGSGSGL